jgi:O-methyltransferase
MEKSPMATDRSAAGRRRAEDSRTSGRNNHGEGSNISCEANAAITRPEHADDHFPVAWMDTRDIAPILDKVRPISMVPRESLIDLARQVNAALSFNIPGDFVECGVWRGGASFLMADLLRQAEIHDRKVWLFDSFEGMPPPEEIDGPAAQAYTENTGSPWYFDNCSATLEEVQQSARDLDLIPYTEFVKGWFDRTLPASRGRIGPIAILRIDGDWYSSVRCCLDNMYDQVVDGGFVILDDYYTFEGCAIALHEFLGERRLAHRIESMVSESADNQHYWGAVFRKGNATWFEARNHMKWMHRQESIAHDIATLVPPTDAVIIVGKEELAGEVAGGRRAIPFLERDGQYWGPPPDDETAIRELERLRQGGAGHIVFAWPAFWWLDHYAGFHRHLRATYRCALENDRLVAFELRA